MGNRITGGTGIGSTTSTSDIGQENRGNGLPHLPPSTTRTRPGLWMDMDVTEEGLMECEWALGPVEDNWVISGDLENYVIGMCWILNGISCISSSGRY